MAMVNTKLEPVVSQKEWFHPHQEVVVILPHITLTPHTSIKRIILYRPHEIITIMERPTAESLFPHMEHVVRKKSHTGMVILKDSILKILATTLVPTMAIPVKTMVISSDVMTVMSN